VGTYWLSIRQHCGSEFWNLGSERERERDAGAVDLCFLDIRQTGLGFEEQRADHLGCSLGDWIRGARSFEAGIWDLEYLAAGWLR